MLPEEPRAVIAALPYLVDATPQSCIMMIGLGEDGAVRHVAAYPSDCERPLDEPLLESSLWGDDIRFGAIVAYSDLPTIDLALVAEAWAHRDRTPVHALWAGPTRWRSFLCHAETCCTARGHRYSAPVRGHDDFNPFFTGGSPSLSWRRQRWDEWQQAIVDSARGFTVEASTIERLARSLHDIPVRDALLSQTVTLEADDRAGLDQVLERMVARSTLGTAIPVHTCVASLQYLDGETASAREYVHRILDAEEYSLARLLANGLDMRAPASLLARSFAHYSPQQLLAA